jgi:hypothetical protein
MRLQICRQEISTDGFVLRLMQPAILKRQIKFPEVLMGINNHGYSELNWILI